ncbi:MAG: hypothetical protein H0X02_07320 [Nitrosomonas sp.]|nr:hypothetical protein [Nitrosomonas sp.]
MSSQPDDVLDEVIDSMLTWDIDGHKEPVIFKPELKAATKAITQDLIPVSSVLEIIGLNENTEGNKPHGDVRNQLRVEQRLALTKIIGGRGLNYEQTQSLANT